MDHDGEEQPDKQSDCELFLKRELDSVESTAWFIFDDIVQETADIYRDALSHEPGILWVSFQTAAGSVSILYNKSLEEITKTSELGNHAGYQKRNRELVLWAQQQGPIICREDFINNKGQSFVCFFSNFVYIKS